MKVTVVIGGGGAAAAAVADYNSIMMNIFTIITINFGNEIRGNYQCNRFSVQYTK